MASYSLRYARSLFQVGRDEGSSTELRYGKLLASFVKNLADSEELRLFLCGPHVSRMRKKEFLSEIFGDPDDLHFLNFLKILVDNDRMEIIFNIDLDYHRLELDSQKIQVAVIESAFPLDDKTVEAVQEAFRKKTGAREIRTTVRLVPELLGGIRVIIGSKVYDGTTRSELDRLHTAMKE